MKILNMHTAALHVSGPAGERFMIAPGHSEEVPDETDIALFSAGGLINIIEPPAPTEESEPEPQPEPEPEPEQSDDTKSKGEGKGGKNADNAAGDQ